jgi:aminoglycoside/choline kinase family phosphotransferase
MHVATNNPGILDFQDAVVGPVTYDLVSLLRDCYIRWPRERVAAWALGYGEMALEAGVLQDCDEAHFLRWFDLMGLQRHLKVLGIFARLWHRDGKPGYLADLPLVLDYAVEVAAGYPTPSRSPPATPSSPRCTTC